ncbi:MAG: ATP-dependent Clp protease proteolytic subunit [Elusimicrobiota bacterium]|nr:MAG: ATP-dependent Clp protease proteolytic subunit [Elusimicrobiota bacterium]
MNFVRPALAALLIAAPLNAQVAVPLAETLKTSKGSKARKLAEPAKPVSVDPAAGTAVAAASAPAAPAGEAAPSVVVTGGGSSPMLPAIPGAPTEERLQLDKITTINGIKQQEYVGRVRSLTEERDEMVIRNTLLAEKLRAELAPLEHEQKKLQIKGQMEDERAAQAVASLRWQRDKARLENELSREKVVAETIRFDADKLKKDVAVAELDFQSRKLRQESELADHKTVAIKADLELRGKKDEWKKAADREPEYLKEPFKNGVLTITDRRIPLEGPIVYGAADFITERIHYFNNKSEEYPIFLVIDRSPGGSVMEGYRILKAMQASKAPVHVVVKSYAASMAATIATLAPRSYAYPNAVILHHQIWSVVFGNPTQQKQQLDVVKEWDRRLRDPIARKMGTSMEKFTARMYERNVDGDWEEFADEAVRLKWIDHIVHEIKETGMLKEPGSKDDEKPKLAFGLAEESDAKGERYVRLPKLQHSDAYFLYSRDGYYR